MLITSHWINRKASKRGNLIESQTSLLGLTIPLSKGWKKQLIGTEISDALADKIVALGKKHRMSKSRPYPIALRGMKRGRPNYFAYIESPAWQSKRQEAFRKYGRKCSVCGSEANLHVHHKTYVRLGRERLRDLQILCADCHAMEHPDKARMTSLDAELRSIIC